MDLKTQIEAAKRNLQRAKMTGSYSDMEAAAKALAPLMTQYAKQRAGEFGVKAKPISHHALLRNTLR